VLRCGGTESKSFRGRCGRGKDGAGSKMELKRDGDETLGFFLQVELAGAMDERDDRFPGVVSHRATEAEIGHQFFLLHAVAVAEGVAVEKNIAANDTPVRPGEGVE